MSDRDSLELRLKRVEDQLELLRLEGAYAFFFDRREAQAWAGLFAEDGVYTRREPGGTGAAVFIQGRANLARFCESNHVDCIHMLHLPHFEIDGDAATSRILIDYRGKSIELGRSTHNASIGCYDTRYRRTGEGWRIHSRVNTIYDRQADTAFGFERSIPDLDVPPRPQSGDYPYRDGRG